jgi:hypothetical protein
MNSTATPPSFQEVVNPTDDLTEIGPIILEIHIRFIKEILLGQIIQIESQMTSYSGKVGWDASANEVRRRSGALLGRHEVRTLWSSKEKADRAYFGMAKSNWRAQ